MVDWLKIFLQRTEQWHSIFFSISRVKGSYDKGGELRVNICGLIQLWCCATNSNLCTFPSISEDASSCSMGPNKRHSLDVHFPDAQHLGWIGVSVYVPLWLFVAIVKNASKGKLQSFQFRVPTFRKQFCIDRWKFIIMFLISYIQLSHKFDIQIWTT